MKARADLAATGLIWQGGEIRVLQECAGQQGLWHDSLTWFSHGTGRME